MKTRERLPRGITRRNNSLVVSFADRNGKIIRRSLGMVSVGFAVEQREIFKREIRQDRHESPKPRMKPTAVSDLFEPYMTDFSNQGGRDPRRWRLAWKWLEPFFGSLPVGGVTTAHIAAYIAARRELGRAAGTVNREVTLLKACFRFGTKQTPAVVDKIPAFPKRLKEAPPRSGFVEHEQYRQLAENARELWLRTLLAVCYTFGLRKGEALNLRVRQVDFLNGWLVLEPDQTKTGKGRRVKLTQETFELLRACAAGKSANSFLLTHEDGTPVRDPRKAWARLTAQAGLPHLLIHDLRRSAVRNMVRAGIPEVACMTISGHKTRSVFDRYNIVNEADLIRASRRLEEAMRQASESCTETVTKTDTSHSVVS